MSYGLKTSKWNVWKTLSELRISEIALPCTAPIIVNLVVLTETSLQCRADSLVPSIPAGYPVRVVTLIRTLISIWIPDGSNCALELPCYCQLTLRQRILYAISNHLQIRSLPTPSFVCKFRNDDLEISCWERRLPLTIFFRHVYLSKNTKLVLRTSNVCC